ncbi:MAG: phosphate acyltransferase PlsX [Candidatus Spyradosoma sp.]
MDAETHSYRIAVDCMGGDKGPEEVVHAVALALRDVGENDKLVLVGREPTLAPHLRRLGLNRDPHIEVRHAPDEIQMTDKPMQALKSKKNASMIVAFEMLKAGEVDAVVSTGNTKVLVGAGTIKVRMMPGCQRPALTAIMPRKAGFTIMVDVGANPETTPEQLVHNTILGSLYSIAMLSTKKPRVGLLTVGTEEGKGGERINKTNAYLKELTKRLDWFEYAGPVEGFDVFQGDVDVIVTDGFTGNIVLKSVEGLVHMLKDILSAKVKRNPLYIVAMLMLYPLLKAVKTQLRPEKFGGAPLLGLNGMVIKAHGSSNRYGTCAAILMARNALASGVSSRAPQALSEANLALEEIKEELVG